MICSRIMLLKHLYSSATNWMYIEHRSLSMRNNTYNWLIKFNNCNNQLILPKRLTFVARPRSIQPVITLTTFSMTFYITSHDCPYLSTISIITFIAQSLSWQLVITLMKLCIKIDEYFEFLFVTWIIMCLIIYYLWRYMMWHPLLTFLSNDSYLLYSAL